MTDRILLYGAGDTGLAVVDMLRTTGIEIVGFIDDFLVGEKLGIPILGGGRQIPEFIKKYKINKIAITISMDLQARKRIVKMAKQLHLDFPNIISKTTTTSSTAIFGSGNIVFSNSVIEHGTRIGDFNIVKPFASLMYNSSIGNFNLVAPYCLVGPYAEIGSGTKVFVRATISHSIRVGDNVTIYPHTLVNANVGNYGHAKGVPAVISYKGDGRI